MVINLLMCNMAPLGSVTFRRRPYSSAFFQRVITGNLPNSPLAGPISAWEAATSPTHLKDAIQSVVTSLLHLVPTGHQYRHPWPLPQGQPPCRQYPLPPGNSWSLKPPSIYNNHLAVSWYRYWLCTLCTVITHWASHWVGITCMKCLIIACLEVCVSVCQMGNNFRWLALISLDVAKICSKSVGEQHWCGFWHHLCLSLEFLPFLWGWLTEII